MKIINFIAEPGNLTTFVKYDDKEYKRYSSYDFPKLSTKLGFYYWLDFPNTTNIEPKYYLILEEAYTLELKKLKREFKLNRILNIKQTIDYSPLFIDQER